MQTNVLQTARIVRSRSLGNLDRLGVP